MLDSAYFGRPLTLDVGWADSPPTSAFVTGGHDGNDALSLNGTAGYAATAGPVLRTDQAYTVSAWADLTAASAADQVVLMQPGPAASTFKLMAHGSSGKWCFTMSYPAAGGGVGWAMACSNTVAVPSVWTHLTGVYNPATGRVELYVNGVAQPATATALAGGIASTGPLTAGSTAGSGNFFGGLVDQIKVFQGAMSAREIAGLARS